MFLVAKTILPIFITYKKNELYKRGFLTSSTHKTNVLQVSNKKTRSKVIPTMCNSYLCNQFKYVIITDMNKKLYIINSVKTLIFYTQIHIIRTTYLNRNYINLNSRFL